MVRACFLLSLTPPYIHTLSFCQHTTGTQEPPGFHPNMSSLSWQRQILPSLKKWSSNPCVLSSLCVVLCCIVGFVFRPPLRRGAATPSSNHLDLARPMHRHGVCLPVACDLVIGPCVLLDRRRLHSCAAALRRMTYMVYVCVYLAKRIEVGRIRGQ